MDSTVVQYLGFIVAALILIWAVVEINRRIYRRNKSLMDSPTRWVELDTRRSEARDEHQPESIMDDYDDEAELHARAKQNGYHAESQRPQI